jgi:maltooligosyltrehalose trehalohydrolase
MIESTQSKAGSRTLVGAECTPQGTYLRVWAPAHKRVEAVFYSPVEAAIEMEPEQGGYFSVLVPSNIGCPGARYKFRPDGGEAYPDPASRWQPDGPHEASMVADCRNFAWTDDRWRGVRLEGQVIYELHVGTFSPEGTYQGVEERLQHLKDTGVTLIELMPINTFPGKFGWGYDGVNLFAPYPPYGTPDDLRHLINKAHEMGIGVILDVVYNHFGPDGNYVAQYAKTYFNQKVKTGWGDAINFDADGSDGVRDFITANARYWIEEFHFDGLRLDATQAIVDSSGDGDAAPYAHHILEEIRLAVDQGAKGRETVVVSENENQDTRQIRPRHEGGYGLDGAWNDDLHHTLRVALTGHSPAYYVAHEGSAQELASAARHGFLFQGQTQGAERGHRGTSTRNLAPWRFITFMENHDQVANSRTGARLRTLTSPGRYRAASAYLLLGPGTPMLFQGQEFGSTRPFAYFADHHKELSALVRAGRGEALEPFVSAWLMRDDDRSSRFPDPADRATFERAKLDWSGADTHDEIVRLYRDLIALRRADPVFAHCRYGTVDAAVLSDSCFVIRYWNDAGERLLVVNLGPDLYRRYMAEPLVAPPEGTDWSPIWSSEDFVYGGNGAPQFEDETGWHVAGESAIAFRPTPLQQGRRRVSSLNGLMFQDETPKENAG